MKNPNAIPQAIRKGLKEIKEATGLKLIGIVLCLSVAVAVIMFVASRHWEILLLLLIGCVWLAWKIKETSETKAHQDKEFCETLMDSTVYVMRLSLGGLEGYLGIPLKGNKGFQSIVRGRAKEKGVLYFILYYACLPNTVALSEEDLAQILDIINSDFARVMGDMAREDIIHVPLCAVEIRRHDGRVAIIVIPILDENARAFAGELRSMAKRRRAVGEVVGTNGGALIDDEL
jgi:hypothetical protein